MPVPGSVLDGAPGYGSQVVTFSVAGAFLAENITPTRPIVEATDFLTDGEPSRSRYTQGKASLTMTLQAPNNTFSGWPQLGETFTATFDANYGAETWVVMQPEVPLTNDASALRKIQISCRKVKYTITTVATPVA